MNNTIQIKSSLFNKIPFSVKIRTNNSVLVKRTIPSISKRWKEDSNTSLSSVQTKTSSFIEDKIEDCNLVKGKEEINLSHKECDKRDNTIKKRKTSNICDCDLIQCLIF